jgi:type II secretory pathway component PulJ
MPDRKEKMRAAMNNENSQHGFSLIELMIAMTVTIVIATIASMLVAQSFRMRSREDARSDAIADAQRALNIVSREIANSGFGLKDNGLVFGDTTGGSIRFRSNLNAYTRDDDGNPVAGAGFVIDPDEDVKYSMYHDDAANRHYLVRFDVNLGGREGTTVLANRLDKFELTYYDMNGSPIDVQADVLNVSLVWKVMIEVGVVLPAVGTPGSPGYQDERPMNLRSEVVLRNASQITY